MNDAPPTNESTEINELTPDGEEIFTQEKKLEYIILEIAAEQNWNHLLKAKNKDWNESSNAIAQLHFLIEYFRLHIFDENGHGNHIDFADKTQIKSYIEQHIKDLITESNENGLKLAEYWRAIVEIMTVEKKTIFNKVKGDTNADKYATLVGEIKAMAAAHIKHHDFRENMAQAYVEASLESHLVRKLSQATRDQIKEATKEWATTEPSDRATDT